MKENGVVTNDHRKKYDSASLDTSLELKNTCLSLKIISFFFTIGTEKVFNSKNQFCVKNLLLFEVC